MRWPANIPKGQAVDTLFSHIDMAPTLLALVGTDVPKTMQGSNLSQVALGKTTQGPEAVLLQIFVPFNPDAIAKPWRGIITATHTYARFENTPWVLFDDQADPAQMHNLAEDAASTTLRNSLEAKLSALMKANGDNWSFNSDELVEEGGRLYKHETFYTIEEYRQWVQRNPEKAAP